MRSLSRLLGHWRATVSGGGSPGATGDLVAFVISPTEPAQLKALGQVSNLPETFGCDVLLIANGVKTGVQRKKFPDDLVASLADGRLYSQLPKMGGLDRSIVVLEGLGRWTADGILVDRYAKLSRGQFYSLINTILWEFGVHVYQVRNLQDTVDWLYALEKWTLKPNHNSLKTRPGPAKTSWGGVSERARRLHVLQSFPGVGVELAGRIYDHFGRVPLKWDVTVEQLRQVPGVGPKKAAAIYENLEGV